MLKKASQAHAGQAKELDKAMKTEKDNYGNEINKAKHAAYKDPKKGEHEQVDPKPSLKSVAKCLPLSNNLSCCCDIQSKPPLLSITTTIGMFS